MVLILIVMLLGAVYGLAWGEWPASLEMLLVGTAYFVMRIADRVYDGKYPRSARILKFGYWFSFVIMAALSAVWTTSLAAQNFLGSIVVWAFGVWVIFYATLIVLTLARFLSAPYASRRVLYSRMISVVLLALIIVLPLTIIEIRSEQDVNQLVVAVNEVAQKKLVPAGAIPYAPNGGPNTFFRKGGLLGRADCNYVHPCPTGGGDWLLVMSKSKSSRHDFAVSTLKSLGYTYGGDTAGGEVGGAKNDVGISLNIIDLSGEKTPYSAPSGKVWQRVQVVAELLKGPTGSNTAQSAQPAMSQYTSKNNHFSFSYPQNWSLENDSSPSSEVLLLKSPGGKFALQPSGEPMATAGEVARVQITPCSSGRTCSLDGVYDGAYQYSDPKTQFQLDDGTLCDSFYFQYRGEQATLYKVFFRDSNKYVFTFNAAGETRDQLDLNNDVGKIFLPLITSIRFDDIK